MKIHLARLLLAFSLCGWSILTAADSPARPAAGATAPATLAGKYAGMWKGPGETGGALRVTLKQETGGSWTTEAAFTFEGAEVPMKMKSAQIEGAKVVLVFDWNVDGTPGQSTLKGELSGEKLGGTYQTVTENPSSGTWSVTRN